MSEIKLNVAGVDNYGRLLVRFDDVQAQIQKIKAEAVREFIDSFRANLSDYGMVDQYGFDYADKIERGVV